MQIEDLIKHLKSDIIHLQETDCNENVFEHCGFIKNSYTVITNNSPSGYGTTSLVKSSLNVENISLYTEGRIIVFDVEGTTFGNVYLESGTDSSSRKARESYCNSVLPNMLVNRSKVGCIGGDWNCLVNKKDASNLPDSKMSPGLKRLIALMDWKDSHQLLHPSSNDFSHYYKFGNVSGATRLHRQYIWGEVSIKKSDYVPVAISDHLGLATEITLANNFQYCKLPKGTKSFKISNEVACDKQFKSRIFTAMSNSQEIRENGLDVLTCWELVVKPGIKKG